MKLIDKINRYFAKRACKQLSKDRFIGKNVNELDYCLSVVDTRSISTPFEYVRVYIDLKGNYFLANKEYNIYFHGYYDNTDNGIYNIPDDISKYFYIILGMYDYCKYKTVVEPSKFILCLIKHRNDFRL